MIVDVALINAIVGVSGWGWGINLCHRTLSSWLGFKKMQDEMWKKYENKFLLHRYDYWQSKAHFFLF